MDAWIDETIGQRYQLQSQLGTKSGRKTFLATDIETQALVVVKLLLFNADFSWDDLKLFEREAVMLKTLEHPSIPKYIDLIDIEAEAGKGFALVQQYIEADSLQQRMESGHTFSEADLHKVAKDLLHILEYLQMRQPPVIHRDIKPSNILMADGSNNSSKIYLVDFGSVQAAQSLRRTLTVVGTYGYMPPEQFGGRAVPASDLYSLGATLIYLATGQHPAELPHVELRLQFSNRVQLSTEFVDWLEWLTEPDLAIRAPNPKEALERLKNPPPRLSLLRSDSLSRLERVKGAQLQVVANPNSLSVYIYRNQFQKRFRFNLLPMPNLAMLYPKSPQKIRKFDVSISVMLLLMILLTVLFELYIAPLLLLTTVQLMPIFFAVSVFFSIYAAKVISKLKLKKSREYCIFCFEKKGDGILLKVISSSDKSMIFQSRLKRIYANSYDPNCKVSFVCKRTLWTIHIQGKKQEILWLCHRLEDWIGWPINYEI